MCIIEVDRVSYCIRMQTCMLDLEVDGIAYRISMHNVLVSMYGLSGFLFFQTWRESGSLGPWLSPQSLGPRLVVQVEVRIGSWDVVGVLMRC